MSCRLLIDTLSNFGILELAHSCIITVDLTGYGDYQNRDAAIVWALLVRKVLKTDVSAPSRQMVATSRTESRDYGGCRCTPSCAAQLPVIVVRWRQSLQAFSQ